MQNPKKMKPGILLFLAAWLLTVPLCAAPPAFKHGETASVLIFTTTDCPIANAMLPEITRIEQEFSKQGVAFTLVQVDPDTNAAAVREHAKSYGISIPSVLDPKHELVNRYKATRTPEAFVILPDDSTAYHGRINDLYHAPGQRRRLPTTNDLRDALERVVSGKPVLKTYQPAIGCVIADFAR